MEDTDIKNKIQHLKGRIKSTVVKGGMVAATLLPQAVSAQEFAQDEDTNNSNKLEIKSLSQTSSENSQSTISWNDALTDTVLTQENVAARKSIETVLNGKQKYMQYVLEGEITPDEYETSQGLQNGMDYYKKKGKYKIKKDVPIGDTKGYYQEGIVHIQKKLSLRKAIKFAKNRPDYTKNDSKELNQAGINFVRYATTKHPGVIAHEGHHLQNDYKGIYKPSADTTWLGWEAMAEINASDEMGARLAKLADIHNSYIEAGGGQKGEKAIEKKYQGVGVLYELYIQMIKYGEIDPMSTNPQKNAEEYNKMASIASSTWNGCDVNAYIYQLYNTAFVAAMKYGITNIKKNETELKHRCNVALTVDITNVKGEIVPVCFAHYGAKADLPNQVRTNLQALDNHPELIKEFANDSQSFKDKTKKMEAVVKLKAEEVLGKETHQNASLSEQTKMNSKQNSTISVDQMISSRQHTN